MRLGNLITTSAAVLAVGIAAPVMAQQAGPGPGNQAQGGSAAAGGDLQSGAGSQASGGSTAVGGDQHNGNTHTDTSASGGSNAASRGGILVSGNTLTVNRSSTRTSTRTNTESDSNSGANGLSASRGAKVDTSATGNGSYAASRGGRNYVGNTATDTTSGAGGVSASRGADIGAVAMGASYAANDGGRISNGNTSIVADQDLNSTVTGNMLAGGVPSERSSPGSPFDGGSNSVSGSAFAAYAGILNQGWNTGFASNVQSAANIAAQGSVTFTGGANGRTSP